MQTTISKFATILLFSALVTACGGPSTGGAGAASQEIAQGGSFNPIQPNRSIQVSASLEDRIRLTYANLSQQDLQAHRPGLSFHGTYAAFSLSSGVMSASFGRPVEAFIPVMLGTTMVTDSSVFYVVIQPSTNVQEQTIAGPFTPANGPILNLSSMSARTQLLQSAYDASQRVAREPGTIWPTKDTDLITFAATVTGQTDGSGLLADTLSASKSIDAGDLSIQWISNISQMLQKANELVAAN